MGGLEQSRRRWKCSQFLMMSLLMQDLNCPLIQTMLVVAGLRNCARNTAWRPVEMTSRALHLPSVKLMCFSLWYMEAVC
ncbi:hypothetical protein DPMN_015699 [Dreissena polymorpha]|uniref:Uncharacterized protein n=1 Tax=Dreissena polymorpha TaxID=45954 RepID=A0A9D4NBY3_DREPO|nr:hypothetical protein DPMN_015699 [Dreissena polymorpha]